MRKRYLWHAYLWELRLRNWLGRPRLLWMEWRGDKRGLIVLKSRRMLISTRLSKIYMRMANGESRLQAERAERLWETGMRRTFGGVL